MARTTFLQQLNGAVAADRTYKLVVLLNQNHYWIGVNGLWKPQNSKHKSIAPATRNHQSTTILLDRAS